MARAKDLAGLAALGFLGYKLHQMGKDKDGPSATAEEKETSDKRAKAQKDAVSGNRVTNESSYTGTTKNDSNAAKNIGFGGGDDSDKNLKRVDSEVKPKPVVVKPKPAVAADEPVGLTTPVSSANRTDQLANLSRAVKREAKTKYAATREPNDPVAKAKFYATGRDSDALKVASRAAAAADRQRKLAKANSYKSGGMTSSASSRADGIAQKGKTRGKVC
jgi:hypothetical protein